MKYKALREQEQASKLKDNLKPKRFYENSSVKFIGGEELSRKLSEAKMTTTITEKV